MAISTLAQQIIPAAPDNYTAGRSRYSTIKEITVHHMAGFMTVEQLGAMWQNPSRDGSSHYGINNTDIACYVSEGDIAWTNSNWEANCRAVTIEVANSAGEPNWPVSDASLQSTVKLVADIAKRNNLGVLVPKQNLTMHKQYSATACPGNYLEHLFQYIADGANKINSGITTVVDNGTFIKNLVPLAQECERKYNLITSGTLAQAIVETGYNGEVGDSSLSELAINANNLFGIKANSSWTGDTYDKVTKEWNGSEYVTITATFRKYDTMQACVEDRAKKLTTEAWYNTIPGMFSDDINEFCHAIHVSPWATSPTYETTLLNRVDKYDLTEYDIAREVVPEPTPEPTPEPSTEVEELKAKLEIAETKMVEAYTLVNDYEARLKEINERSTI